MSERVIVPVDSKIESVLEFGSMIMKNKNNDLLVLDEPLLLQLEAILTGK